MAELASLSIVVDVSSLASAVTKVSNFSKSIEALAVALGKVATPAQGVVTALNAIGSAAQKASNDLSPAVKSLQSFNRTMGEVKIGRLKEYSAGLTGLASGAKEAGAALSGLKMPAIPRSRSQGGGRGDSTFDLFGASGKLRAGMAVTGQGGINPFAVGMVELPPIAAAAAVALGVVGGAVAKTAEALYSLGSAAVETGMRFQRMTATLAVVGGGRAGAAKEFEYITTVANRFGIGLEAATNSYSKFALSAQVAGVATKDSRAVFEAVSKAIVATGVSSDAGSRAFLGLEQALSKGTLQAEEVKKQFAGNLPGGFALFAEAAHRAGKTADSSISTFMAAMKTGTLDSKAVILELAKVMEEKFGTAFAESSNNLERNLSRMGNAWDMLLLKLADMGIMNAVNVVVRALSDSLGNLYTWLDNLSKSLEGARLKEAFLDLGLAVGGTAKKITAFITETKEEDLRSFTDAIVKLTDRINKLNASWDTLTTTFNVVTFSFQALKYLGDKTKEYIITPILDGLTGADKALRDFNARAQKTASFKERATTFAASKLGSTILGGSATVEVTDNGPPAGASAATEVSMGRMSGTVSRIVNETERWRTSIEDMARMGLPEVNASAQQHLNTWERINAELEGNRIRMEAIQGGGSGKKYTPGDSKFRVHAAEEEEIERLLGTKTRKDAVIDLGILKEKLLDAWKSGKISAEQYYMVLEGVSKKTETLGTTIAKGVGGAFATLADSMVNMALTGEGSFKEMVSSMLKQIAKMIFYYGVLLPLVQKVFGGSSWGDAIVQGFSGKKASGGSVSSGSSYLVGERGPEMFVPGRSGAIIPNGALGGGSSISIQVNVTPSSVSAKTEKGGNEDNSRSFRELGVQIGDAVRSVIIDELRPGGLIKEAR